MRISLLWRSFLLIAGLVVACLLLMLELMRVFDPTPAEQTLAWELSSIVNLTRTALVSTHSDRRRQLLSELASEEGVRVAPLEPTDRTEPLLPASRARALQQRLKGQLGGVPMLASRVNGESGLWVSFDIDGDPYWLGLAANRFERQLGPPWWAFAGLALALGLLGAFAVAAPLTKPLANLSGALGRVSRGESPPALPESGPSEIAALNRRFNRMVADLIALESDRAVALAGISHDIRTPLTRLRMEIELSSLDEETKASMADDITRIDAIVSKFVEYARAASSERTADRIAAVPVLDSLEGVRQSYQAREQAGELALAIEADEALRWRGDSLDLTRIVANLLENALRYGANPQTGIVQVRLAARRVAGGVELSVADQGPGVPPQERARLLRPFSRLDSERSERGGSGLGLAIVSRLAQRYGGHCELGQTPGGGLTVRVVLPDHAAAPSRDQ